MADKIINANDLMNVVRDDDRINGYDFAIIRDHINEMPVVDAVEVVYGHWLSTTYMIPSVMCSECSYPVGKEYEKEFKYCPNCGAKMEVVQ